MNRLEHLANAIDAASDATGKVIRWLIVAITAVVLAEVVSRYVFDSTLIWTHETAKFMYGSYSVLGGAYALRWGAHVNVDVLHRRWSPRTQAIVDSATAPFFFLVCAVVMWQGWLLFWQSYTVNAHTWSIWGQPLAPVHAMIPLASTLLLIQGVAHYIRIFRASRSGGEGADL